VKVRWLAAVGVASWMVGAAPVAWTYGTNQVPASPAVEQLGGRVAVQLSSAIAEPYYVLSGPAESYAAFPFNAMFREALDRYVAAKSGPGAAGVTLVIHLEALTTGYQQLGAGLLPERERWAAAEPIRLASAGVEVARGPFGGLSDFDREGGDWSFPAEIYKSATLQFTAEVRSAEGPAVREVLSAKSDVTVTWDDWDPWGPQWALRAYDYGPVLQQVIRNAMVRVDAFVDQAVQGAGK